MKQLIFYALARKPVRDGRALMSSAPAGRRYWRLEATPATVFEVPDDWGASEAEAWAKDTPAVSGYAAYALDSVVRMLPTMCSDVPHAGEQVQLAIKRHAAGKPGWIVFNNGK